MSFLRELDEDFENACPTVEEIAFVMRALDTKRAKKDAGSTRDKKERNRVSARRAHAKREEERKQLRQRCAYLERENELMKDALAIAETFRRRCACLEADNVVMHALIQAHPGLREHYARVPAPPPPPSPDASATSSTDVIAIPGRGEVLGERI